MQLKTAIIHLKIHLLDRVADLKFNARLLKPIRTKSRIDYIV